MNDLAFYRTISRLLRSVLAWSDQSENKAPPLLPSQRFLSSPLTKHESMRTTCLGPVPNGRLMFHAQAIRRSIKGEKDTRPLHNSIGPKSAIAIQPPKKVCSLACAVIMGRELTHAAHRRSSKRSTTTNRGGAIHRNWGLPKGTSFT